VLSVLAVAFLGIGVGLLVAPVAVAGVRALANLHRRLALDWSGVEIPVPYRPRPEPTRSHLRNGLRSVRWLLTDPASAHRTDSSRYLPSNQCKWRFCPKTNVMSRMTTLR